MSSVTRLLLIEDDPVDAHLFREMLAEQASMRYEVDWGTSLAAAKERLSATQHNAILMDLGLPDSRGLETFLAVRACPSTAAIVVLTDLDDERLGARAVRDGAGDYMPKGELTGPLLVRSIRYAIERKKAADALRAANEEHRSIIEASPLAIISVDNAGCVSSWSPAARRTLGWTEEEVLGKPTPIQLTDEHKQACQNLWAILASERFTGAEIQVLTKDGRPIDVSISSAPIRDEQGASPGAVIIVEDITAQHSLEDQLRQAQKLEAIGQLAGGVAHDFNNLLAGIMGYSELMVGLVKDEPRLHRDATAILAASQRAADLTAQLLAFSGRGKTRTERVDINAVIEEVARLLERIIDPRIRLHMDLCATAPIVFGDPSLLQNSILNLAVNARDAMPDGGDLALASRVVDIGREAEATELYNLAPDQYVEISVADTGTGIGEALKQRIFEPFFTTKEVGKGAGLGLAAVYGTVRDHGGGLKVDSQEGRGSTFFVYLPVSHTVAPPSTRAAESQQATTGSGTILMVDDEGIVRHVAAEILGSCGYTVLEACNGREAVEIYRTRHAEIDLVILDMVMPELSGRQAFTEMRRLNPNVRAIISSGYSLDLEADVLSERGILGLVPKPYRKNSLCEAVAVALADP